MKDIVVVGALIVAWAVFSGHSSTPITGPAAHWHGGKIGKEEVVTTADGTPEGLINAIERSYGTPGFYTYLTWKIESNGLEEGSGTGKHWYPASELAQEGSICQSNKTQALGVTEAYAWCQKQWRALNLICAQTDKDGVKVCDPETVQVSWAFAMGPMQILPSNIVKVEDDGVTVTWVSNATDYDGDGAVNPLKLPDAMAMAAKLSNFFHEKKVGGGDSLESWLATSDKYKGGNSPQRRAKAKEYAAEWCESHECGKYGEAIASR